MSWFRRRGRAADRLQPHGATEADKRTQQRVTQQFKGNGGGAFSEVEATNARRILRAIAGAEAQSVSRRAFERRLAEMGIEPDDPRIARTRAGFEAVGDSERTPAEVFEREVLDAGEAGFILRVLAGELTVPDFPRFRDRIGGLVDFARDYNDGRVADYIPQLARVDPEKYAVALCTIDGQRMAFGDAAERFCLQSACKPVNYAIALEQFGVSIVHAHVGKEPSGVRFNELKLNQVGRPHNPMINAGAIIACSLIKPNLPLAERFDYVMSIWRAMSGGEPPAFDNAVYHSEKDTADRNFALAYFMRENGAFPEGSDMLAALDFYFQCCSVTLTARQMAVAAATLANGGVCPLTDTRVFNPETVKNCLSLMYSCGMYDYSGEFAFTVGLPAKSGVSGAMFIVIPNFGGVAIWSPRVDAHGNSVRGVEFANRLVETFPFHTYAQLSPGFTRADPRHAGTRYATDETARLCWAAARGDDREIIRLIAGGADVRLADYDGRTPLHLAAAEGRARAAKLLLEAGASSDAPDRWGRTPLEEARRCGDADLLGVFAQSPSGGG